MSRRLTEEELIRQYYENPNYCHTCGKLIKIGEGQKVCDVRVKKFCSRSCSARYNNKGRNRWARLTGKEDCSKGLCESCGKEINYKKQKSGAYSPKRFCASCRPKRVAEIRFRQNGKYSKPVEERTKGELKALEVNPAWVRSRITNHARNVYQVSGKLLECSMCDFPHGIQVCHIIPISKFSDETLVSKINDLSNLIALCPNHHWMLDHKLLTARSSIG
jgi:hypothetical protein